MTRLESIEEVPDEYLMTVAEVSARGLGSESHIYDLINAGEIGYCDIRGKGSSKAKLRIPISSFRKYIEDRTVPARLSA